MSLLDAWNKAMETDPDYIAANDPNNPRYAEFDKAVQAKIEQGNKTAGPILDDDQSLIEKSIQTKATAKKIVDDTLILKAIETTIGKVMKEWFARRDYRNTWLRIGIVNEANNQFWERMKARDEYCTWKREQGLK